uniref:Uncharacterized protein n=1 Tax=viral metagenome TaxID=1070528 RepID=A0A6M3K1B8_9ZZZZ
MADNITLNAGSGGATLATDDDGTAQHQYVKLEFGADGVFTQVDASNPLPVDLGANNDVTVTGTVTANLGTIAGIALDATLAAQSAKLPATLGQKTKAAALAVTLASDEDALAVTAASLPLPTGAATAANQTTGNTSLATIAGDTTSIDGKITACNTGAVVVSSGAITETNSGAIKTAVEIIDNAVAASGGATGSGVVLMGKDSISGTASNLLSESGYLQIRNMNTTTSGVYIRPGTGVNLNTSAIGGTVAISAQQPGYSTLNLGKRVDDAAGVVDVGVANLAVRDDALGGLTPIEGDYANLRVDANGALWVIPSGTVTVDGSGVVQPVSGTVAVTGVATETTLAAQSAKLPAALGQKAMAASMAVVLASDQSAIPVTGAGGGTQYDEDDGHTTGDTGTMALAVRNDSDASLCGTTLDYTPLQVDANGFLKVNIKAGAGSGGTAMTDDAAFTAGTTNITPAGAMFDDVAPDSVDEGDGGVLRMSANRNLYATLRDAAGNERGANVDASNQLTVVEENSATIAGDTTSIDGKITACNTGAVVVSSGAITETNSGAIKTAVETIDNAISGSEMQVDVVAALPVGTNAIGKLAANSGVDIGDVDVTSLPDSIDGPGAPVIVSYTTDDINLAAATANQVLVAAQGADTQIWVYALVGTADDDGTISIQDEDDTALSGVMPVAANGGFAINPSGNFAMPWIKVATNKALECDTLVCAFDGIITWAKVDVS